MSITSHIHTMCRAFNGHSFWQWTISDNFESIFVLFRLALEIEYNIHKMDMHRIWPVSYANPDDLVDAFYAFAGCSSCTWFYFNRNKAQIKSVCSVNQNIFNLMTEKGITSKLYEYMFTTHSFVGHWIHWMPSSLHVPDDKRSDGNRKWSLNTIL